MAKKQKSQINIRNLDKHGLDDAHARLFYEMVRDYETRKTSSAMKTADIILKAYPKHGETMAMKALMLKNKGKDEEADTLVKEAIKQSMKSHICWHVYGLLHKTDSDYKKALSCFNTAIRFDANNLQILRDLANVQAQLRDFKGLTATATKLLQLKPDIRNFWAMLAIASFFNGQYQAAITTLDSMVTARVLSDCTKAELGEVQMFKNLCLRESGDYAAALKHLDTIKTIVPDRIGWLETKAECLMKTGKASQAADYYIELLKLNPDCYEYLSHLQVCKGMPSEVTHATLPEDADRLLKHYDSLAQQLPQSTAIPRIALNFASGDEFKQRLDAYVRNYIKKTIPSLFLSLKSLYSDEDKVSIIEQYFLSIEQSLGTGNVFPGLEEEVQPPTAYLWVLQFLGYHFDKVGQVEKAIEYIDKAIAHSPTVVELYLCKARILKHTGDQKGAASCMEQARKMDLADRYLNTKTTKYLLRADKTEQALDTINLFAMQGPGEEKKSNIHEMQTMWFEIEAGNSYLRQKDYSQALQQLRYVIRHFEEIENDQYDFHGYCLRKLTLCAYVEMLRFEDRLRSHPYFFEASSSLVKTFLELDDNPDAAKEAISATEKKTKEYLEEQEEKMRKKEEELKNKPKKKKKEEDEEEESSDKIDKDPFCLTMLQASDYIDEAIKLLGPLEKFSADKLETHVLGIEVYLKKRKYVQVMMAIKTARKIDASNPRIHCGTIRLFHEAYSQEGGPDAVVKQILARSKDELLGPFEIDTSGLQAYNASFLEKYGSSSLAARIAVAECMVLLDPSSTEAAAALIVEHEPATRGPVMRQSLQDHLDALVCLRTTIKHPEATEQFLAKAHERFPHCNAFHQ